MGLSQPQIVERLAARNFTALLGEFESTWLECKRAPYVLDREHDRLELAKDVSGLANAGGGLILLGYATRQDQTHGVDVIAECRPIPLAEFREEKYRAVILDWTWPKFSGVSVKVYEDPSDSQKGVVLLEVARCSPNEYPLLVCKTVLDEKRADILVGYCERKRGAVVSEQAARLHAYIVAGIRNMEVIERLDGITALLGARDSVSNQSAVNPDVTTAPSYIPTRPSNIDGRITEAIEAAGLHASPAFVLTAAAIAPVDTTELFSSRESALVRLIENPPELRGSGFDLNTGASSHIVRGQMRRTVVPGTKELELHRDGLLIFVNAGGGDGLCRARHETDDVRLINQLVLIENTYLFCLLARQVYEGRIPADCDVEYRSLLIRVCSSQRPCALQAGPINEWRDGPTRKETDEQIQFVLSQPFRVPPERVAFLLLSEIYLRFGFETESIAYTRKAAGVGTIIDGEAIQAAGRRSS